MLRGAATAGVAVRSMASGGGHAALGLGVPTAMLFIRNEHGGHNPDEAMEMADFVATLEAAIGEIAA